MFAWMSSKPDHPLADRKAARELLADMRGGDPVVRLDEVTAYLESLLRVEGFKVGRLYEIIDLLDQAAKPHQRKIGAEYIGASRLTRFQDNRLWKSASDFWRALGQAYMCCLERTQTDAKEKRSFGELTPVCGARVLRALGAEFKWVSLRYGPVPQYLWANAATVYAIAETAGVAQQPIRAYPVSYGDTSVQQEYLRLLVLQVASPDALMPAQVELAERAVAWFSRSFVMSTERSEETTHYVDLATQRPPGRLTRSVAASPNRRYFGIARGRGEIAALLKVVKEREVIPDSVRLGQAHSIPLVIHTLEHLLRQLGPRPPARGSERAASLVRLMVTHGFRQVRETVLRERRNEPLRPIDIETWVAIDESAGGYGARIHQLRGDWIKLGALVGVKAETSRYWGLGVVRRLVREGETDYRIGLQVWTRAVLPIELRPIDPGGRPGAQRSALLLSLRPDENGEVEVALEVGGFSGSGRYAVQINGQQLMLLPSRLIEAGDDFDLARYRVRKYEVA